MEQLPFDRKERDRIFRIAEDDDRNAVYKKSDGYLLAGSFDEFLTRIGLFEEQGED